MSDKKVKENRQPGVLEPLDDLKIKIIESNKNKVYVKSAMKNGVIPQHPFRMIISGASGSGKSMLLMNLLTMPQYYGGGVLTQSDGEKKRIKPFFHVIFIISPTAGKTDDLYKELEKQKNKIIIINEPDEDELMEIIDMNLEHIEKNGVHKSPRILICYDDIIHCKKFLNCKAFTKSYIASRHYNASVIVCSQKYNALPRVCRIQCNAVMYFRGNSTEDERLAEEHSPPGFKKRDFITKIIDNATDQPYQFLFINLQEPFKTRYRKGLGIIMELKK